MKILIYNWVQFDNPHLAGGGVTVYLQNVIEELLRRDGVEVYFLSSGHRYGLIDRRPKIRPTPNAMNHPRLKTFTLWNSPVKAPAHDAFYAIDTWRNDKVTVKLIERFLRQHGPFDAMHVHNLEGIGAGVLSMPSGAHLKRRFYTVHNYMPVCPQIELLYDGRKPCVDFSGGHRCVGCLAHENRMEDLIAMRRVGDYIDFQGFAGHPVGGFLFDSLSAGHYMWKALRNLFVDVRHGLRTRFALWKRRPRPGPGGRFDWRATSGTPRLPQHPLHRRERLATAYRLWREENALALATRMDGVFAVSDVAREAMLRFMPPDARIETLPLPIDVEPNAEERARLEEVQSAHETVTLSFVGYAIPSKGLPFLLDALAEIDDPFYREKVDLVIVASLGGQRARQVVQLKPRFRSITLVPHYRRDQLVQLAERIDLNIVPSIWWETFNQVTVELGRLGVPSLVSSTVGAKMVLPHHDRFVFESGNPADFRAKLDKLVKHPALRASFHDRPLAMPAIREHVDHLMGAYLGRALPAPDRVAGAADGKGAAKTSGAAKRSSKEKLSSGTGGGAGALVVRKKGAASAKRRNSPPMTTDAT